MRLRFEYISIAGQDAPFSLLEAPRSSTSFGNTLLKPEMFKLVLLIGTLAVATEGLIDWHPLVLSKV